MTDSKAASQEVEVSDHFIDVGPDQPYLVVGVGASAGGLEALESFFQHTPINLGITYVVVQHLSPHFKSLMPELLARKTSMPISLVETGMSLQRDHVYLIPPGTEISLKNERFQLHAKNVDAGLSLPINVFFNSLAESYGKRAVAIILSGSGSDGREGVRSVHNSDGLVIVQDENSAAFDSMPKSALGTEFVDCVLLPEQIGDTLQAYLQDPYTKYLPGSVTNSEGDIAGLGRIFSLLNKDFGLDFNQYKSATVSRRVIKRMLVNEFESLKSYIDFAEGSPQEREALYQDLLIGVTSFFRDPEAFSDLAEQVIPEIISRSSYSNEIKVWSAGCATGEEPYSLAILFHEVAKSLGKTINLKIFASDAHQTSLDFASAGRYPSETLSSVTPELLARYFEPSGVGHYALNKQIRSCIVFARHNVISDAPFTSIDLVTCRNLLIYLQPHAQKKALSFLHFALKLSGFLFLGSSETPGDLSSEFKEINRASKIYQKLRKVLLAPDAATSVKSDVINSKIRQRLHTHQPDKVTGPELNLFQAYDEVLRALSLNGILISDKKEVLHTFGDNNQYLSFPLGRLSRNLIELVDRELRLPLSGAIQTAERENKVVIFEGIELTTKEEQQNIRITVRPLRRSSSEQLWFFVSLKNLLEEETEEAHYSRRVVRSVDIDLEARETIRSLEGELADTKEDLQLTIEKLEASNEEVQATNEELITSNEELQSTNEELHSVNEELYTVNSEFQKKIAELTELTDDMNNFFRATDIGTIFLDEQLEIRKFTPTVSAILGLRDSDVGRRLETFAIQIDYPHLIDDIKIVLSTGMTIEKEAPGVNNSWFLVRCIPYRTDSAAIEGVILSFIETTSIKQAELKMRERTHELEQFSRIAINREERVLELKNLVNELCVELGKDEMFDVSEILEGSND